MDREPYITPEIESEVLEAGALGCYGSPAGDENQPWLANWSNPSSGVCCEN